MTRAQLPTALVTAVAGCFAVVLTSLTDVIFRLVLADELGGGTAGILAGIAVVCIVVVSVVVSAIVTLTTVQHVVEEERGVIALRRLLGASAAQERRRLVARSLLVGVVGLLAGGVVGVAAQLAVTRTIAQLAGIPLDAVVLSPASVAPLVAIAVSTALVARLGTRGVLRVTPIEALGAAAAQPREPARRLGSAVVLCVGVAVLLGSVALALLSPFAVLVAVAGGVLVSAGVIGVAQRTMPPAIVAVGRALGRSVPARAAVRAAADARDRSSGLVLALAVGIATVTMLVVAGTSMREALVAIERDPATVAAITSLIDSIVTVLAVLVGCSAVVAVLGFVTSMLTAVRQRTREIGLLRALGMTGAQVRWMITAETVAITVVALVLGLVLGVGFGWVGVWTLFASVRGIGPILPIVGPWFVVGLVSASAVIALVAAAPATRRARMIAPTAALQSP